MPITKHAFRHNDCDKSKCPIRRNRLQLRLVRGRYSSSNTIRITSTESKERIRYETIFSSSMRLWEVSLMANPSPNNPYNYNYDGGINLKQSKHPTVFNKKTSSKNSSSFSVNLTENKRGAIQ